MQITVISVGTIKESYLRDALQEYNKRIGTYATLREISIPESRITNEDDPKQVAAALSQEGEAILSRIPTGWRGNSFPPRNSLGLWQMRATPRANWCSSSAPRTDLRPPLKRLVTCVYLCQNSPSPISSCVSFSPRRSTAPSPFWQGRSITNNTQNNRFRIRF